MFNKIILMGRLVADPELKTTPQGVNVCTFRIAVDRRFQKQGEEVRLFQHRGMETDRRVCPEVLRQGARDTCRG